MFLNNFKTNKDSQPPSKKLWCEIPVINIQFHYQGFVAFSLHNVQLSVIRVSATTTCPQVLCSGMYGPDCPCHFKPKYEKAALMFEFFVMQINEDGTMKNLSAELGRQIVPLISNIWTEALVDSTVLQVVNFHICYKYIILHIPRV